MKKDYICSKVKRSVGWGRDPKNPNYCSINQFNCPDPTDIYCKTLLKTYKLENIGRNYLK